jgi:hypothetical protein
MKKTTVFSTIFILLIYQSLLSGQQNQKPAEDFFKDVRNASLEVLPDSFKAGLSGQAIDKKLSSIPLDSYLDKSKNASAEVFYSKMKGITITVLNVDDLYRDMYKDLPRQFFAFDILLSERSTDSFLNKYEMSYYGSGFDPVVLRLRIKGAENTVLLYVDRANYRIHRIDYLLGGSLISTTEVFYNDYVKEGKTYTVPCRFVTKSCNGSNSVRYDILEMVNINLNSQ